MDEIIHYNFYKLIFDKKVSNNCQYLFFTNNYSNYCNEILSNKYKYYNIVIILVI